MKKAVLFFLILSLFILFAYGCGQTYSSGSAPAPHSGLRIISWSPITGESDVASTAAISITFNNTMDVTSFTSFSQITAAADNAAGNPLGTITWEWAANHKTVTIEGITGWTSMATTTEAPIWVHLVNRNAFKDIYNQKLATGETIAKYYLAEEFWRYLPLITGNQIELIVRRNGETDPDKMVTFEMDTITGTKINGYTAISVFYITTEGSGYYSDTSYVKVSSTEIISWMDFGYGLPTPTIEGLALLKAPIVIGGTWSKDYDVGVGAPATATVTVEGKETLHLPIGNIPAYRVNLWMNIPGIGSGNAMKLWFAYNRGYVKQIEYKDDGITIYSTYEAVRYGHDIFPVP